MIGIIDYGMGNLRSVEKAFERIGYGVKIIRTSEEIANSAKLILPGVGSFGQAMENLRQLDLLEPLRDSLREGKPLLGICLGLQLLFQESEEHGLHEGLAFFRGRVRRLPEGVKVPHIGWNQIDIQSGSPLLKGVLDGSFFYFVQSYYVEPGGAVSPESTTTLAPGGAVRPKSATTPPRVIATTDYGIEFASIVTRGNVFGVQFHPEKSQDLGLRLLKNFGGL